MRALFGDYAFILSERSASWPKFVFAHAQRISFSKPKSWLKPLRTFPSNQCMTKKRAGLCRRRVRGLLVAPTGFEPATSALRGRSKRKTLHNSSERFRWSEIFSYLHSLTVRNAPFGTILDWILDRFLTAENREHRQLQELITWQMRGETKWKVLLRSPSTTPGIAPANAKARTKTG